MSRRARCLALASCALAGTLLLRSGIVGMSAGLLFLAPAVLLALPLLTGRYIGAERLSRIAHARSPRRRRRAAAGLLPRARGRVLPRGGLLIAASLAVRPPPSVLSH